jgi:DNA-binding MarR family transcriptional regulator
LNYYYPMLNDHPFIESVRSFNRFYTNIIGLLDQHFLDSPFSLTEGRVLYEIRHTEGCSAKKIRGNIAIDEGYLSRIIDKFIRQGLIKKKPSSADRRLHIIELTKKGQIEFSKLNNNSNKLISQKFGKLSQNERNDLIIMMKTIRVFLSKND